MKHGWNLSICGLNCAVCDMYMASHGDEELRQEIIECFKNERKRAIKPEQVRCEGCRGPTGVHWSPDCQILQCAKKRGPHYCFECKDFPCNILNAFASDDVTHHKRTVENLKKMKEIGMEAWITEQEKKGPPAFCP